MVLMRNEKHLNIMHNISVGRTAVAAVLCICIFPQVLWSAATSKAESMIWLEVEQFEKCGGWSNDCQFDSALLAAADQSI